MLSILIKHNADLEKTLPSGYTALLLAAQSGSTESVRVLVNAGANIHHSAIDGNALHLASANGRLSTVKYLLGLGLDPNLFSVDEETPLHMAVKRSHSVVADLLRQYGANGRLKNGEGQTADKIEQNVRAEINHREETGRKNITLVGDEDDVDVDIVDENEEDSMGFIERNEDNSLDDSQPELEMEETIQDVDAEEETFYPQADADIFFDNHNDDNKKPSGSITEPFEMEISEEEIAFRNDPKMKELYEELTAGPCSDLDSDYESDSSTIPQSSHCNSNSPQHNEEEEKKEEEPTEDKEVVILPRIKDLPLERDKNRMSRPIQKKKRTHPFSFEAITKQAAKEKKKYKALLANKTNELVMLQRRHETLMDQIQDIQAKNLQLSKENDFLFHIPSNTFSGPPLPSSSRPRPHRQLSPSPSSSSSSHTSTSFHSLIAKNLQIPKGSGPGSPVKNSPLSSNSPTRNSLRLRASSFFEK
eukprot:TRINITY_DN930_c0_g1_i3.p1 TRINITY_DN930_c0_g1~~TRINITY_DN930_c0_g1_i3.p1  ORF type:complete len:475 (+),score=149.31 TRINITY_DN930_c0_g1_i3:1252-2676(+)